VAFRSHKINPPCPSPPRSGVWRYALDWRVSRVVWAYPLIPASSAAVFLALVYLPARARHCGAQAGGRGVRRLRSSLSGRLSAGGGGGGGALGRGAGGAAADAVAVGGADGAAGPPPQATGADAA
jgi:hypothetical protein